MMKNILLLLVAVSSFCILNAQTDPVSWKFTARKISEKEYEIHMTASLQTGWHLYSQSQPKDAIAVPTKFQFTRNPLVASSGTIKEVGKMEKFHDATIGVSAHQYANSVEFVQKVTLKAGAKTALSGVVEYQTCNDQKCLPSKKLPFKIPLS